MDPEIINALIVTVATVFIAAVTGTWALGRRHEKTELSKLQMEHNAKASETKQEHTESVAQLKQQLTDVQARSQQLQTELEQVTHQHKSLLSGRTGVVLKTNIDHELIQGMTVLGATAASVLVPAPPPNNQTSLVFLSAFGPVAARIRYELVPIDGSKAGKVFEAGLPDNSQDPRREPDWDPAVDTKAESSTQMLLTVPVKLASAPEQALAVCQFLNKQNGNAFSEQDEQIARQVAQRIAPSIYEFLSDERNYEVIGIPLNQPRYEASVMFCDLTASTDLLKIMNTPSALLRLDEYLESLGEIALAYGAKLIASLGDGMLLSFNVPKQLDNHVQCAIDAAWAMQQDFDRIWRGWQLYDLRHLHNRISIAAGPVVLANVGPKQSRQETIIGPVVNHANRLCRIAPRDRDVIVVDGEVANRVTGYRLEELTAPEAPATRPPPRTYHVTGTA